MMTSTSRTQQLCLIVSCWVLGIISCLLFFQYISPQSSPYLIPPYKPNIKSLNISISIPEPETPSKEEKPTLLLWFWPQNYRFDFSDCKKFYNIDGCHLTDDRNLYNQADAVLIFHRALRGVSSLPPSPRPAFQRWIWFNVESPSHTRKTPGLENLFNLTLSYRKDADISVRYWLTANKTPNVDFVIPKKDKLVCWIVSHTDPSPGTNNRMNYYKELKKYVNISIFGGLAGSRLKPEDYYPTLASCKFYLAFENSVHRDYITEKVNGPLSVGTVPVVLGPPRKNYEDFYPPNSFIHIDDFPNHQALANYLLQLDKDDEAYRRFFDWKRHITATPHLVQQHQEFIIYICHACEYIGRHNEYKAAHDIYKWWFS